MGAHNEGWWIDRRTLLVGTASLLTAGIPGASAEPTIPPASERPVVTGAFAPEVPHNVSDPYLVSTHGTPPLTESRGWEATSRDTLTASLLDLDLDVLSVQDLTGFSGPPLDAVYASRHTTIGRFAYRWGLPHSSGFTRILEADTVQRNWYQDLTDAERWTKPDGTPVEHPMELAARTFDGGAHLWAEGTSSVVPSVFAPGTLDYEGSVGSQIFQLGANQLFVDGFELARLKGNDFSVWAREAFRQHLHALPEHRLDELDIDDPDSFDVRTYLEEHGVAPGSSNDNPARNPVYREYTRRHHQRHKRYARQLAERTTSGAPDAVAAAGTTFFGNQAGIAGPRAAPIYLSDAVDEIGIEVDPTLPPDRPHDVTVKTGLAAGRFEKPVRIEGKLHRIRAVDTLHGLDPERQYPILMQFQVAQAYAHGGLRGLSLSSWADVHERDVANDWVRPDGTIADSLQEFTDFVRASERLLKPTEPANDTALVVSLPTLIWQRAPQWGRHVPDHSDAVRGAATVLRRAHVPYDVVLFDYEPVWASQSQRERIRAYDTVVLPGVESVSDDQLAALRTAVDGGTTVIATGGAPDRDEEYRSRADVRSFLEASPNGVIVESDPECGEAGPGREAMRSALPSDRWQVELGTEADISVNVMQSPDSDLVVVHLLNFEYEPRTDSTPTRTDLTVTVRDLPFQPGVANYHSPAGITELSLSGDGGASSVEVPSLDVWGFIIFGADVSSSASTTERAAAAERIDEARDRVARAEAAGRTRRLVQANATLGNAARALEYGAFTRADSLAKDTIEAAAAAYRPPTIGIDQGHNQSNEYYEADLGTLRDTFDSYDYEAVHDWTPETFKAIDLLIFPPLTAEAETGYGFDATELEAVESFVRNGGSLLLLGVHRTKPGFNRLASRFGFELDGRPINRGQGDFWAFDVESPLSAVTAFVPTWDGKFGTVVERVGDGTVLGRVSAESQSWLTSQQPIEEQGPDEPSAAGKPVLVGRKFGEGHVVLSGEAQQFVEPTTPDGKPAPLPEQLLRILGRRARYVRRSPPETTSGATEQPSPLTSSRTTAGTTEPQATPGFGVVAGIGGIAGFAALLKWLFDEDDS